MFRRLFKDLDARESRVIEDGLHTGYNPQNDTMAELDGGPKQDFQNGMLARLARFENSRAGRIVERICWFGMIGVAIVALNLFLGRPWF